MAGQSGGVGTGPSRQLFGGSSRAALADAPAPSGSQDFPDGGALPPELVEPISLIVAATPVYGLAAYAVNSTVVNGAGEIIEQDMLEAMIDEDIAAATNSSIAGMRSAATLEEVEAIATEFEVLFEELVSLAEFVAIL